MSEAGTAMTDDGGDLFGDDSVGDALVAEYLRRLDAAAWSLPADRRVELVAEIADHIAHARATAEVSDEASLRELLDRLGDPADIVAEACADVDAVTVPAGPGPVPRTVRPGIALEVSAVALLTVGSIIPFVGWLVGVVLAWLSRRFTVTEKILLTLVVPFGPFTAVLLAARLASQRCSATFSSDAAGNLVSGPTVCTGFAFPVWLGVPLMVATVVAPFVIGGVVLRRARDRAALEPAIPVAGPPGASGPNRWGALEIAAVLLLSVGGFLLPVVGPFAGLVCAWVSTAWTSTEKWVATAITSAALVIPLTLAVMFAVL